jgi:single-stranded-DNA-specific exonuclease
MAWAVAERLRAPMDEAKRKTVREALRDAVALAALATVSDVMPLVGENRVIVSSGLAALRGSRSPGLRALLEVARLGDAPLTTEDVAFRIAPRLNAAGRLSRPDIVVRMLTCTDETEARALARSLDQANEERRRIERSVLAQATDEAHRRMDGTDRHSLVVHGQGWHRGVIGIVAARLLDRHRRPVAVIGLDGDLGRGSCRSVPHVDLHRALTECGAHLVRYGGHAMAAGFDIQRGSLDRFCDAFEEAVRSQTNGHSREPSITVDAECEIDALNLEAVTALARLAPFGPGNPEPVFLVRGAVVAGRAQLMGETRGHLAFALKQNGGAIRVVGFRRADLWDLVTSGKPIDVAVSPALDEWRGVRTPELRLVDARASAGS